MSQYRRGGVTMYGVLAITLILIQRYVAYGPADTAHLIGVLAVGMIASLVLGVWDGPESR